MNKIINKILMFLLIFVLFGAGLSSCGESSSSNSSSSSSSSSSISSSSSSSSSVVQKFNVSFFDESGKLLEKREWNEGSTPSYSYQVTDTKEWDYTFEGWSTELNGEVVSLPKVTQEMTYYAVVSKEKQRYIVTFETNGGSTISPLTVEYGDSINEPENPVKEGYRFVSWAIDDALKTQASWPIVVEDDLTLYASWNEKVDIKGYLNALLEETKVSPYSYIPDSLEPGNSKNHVQKEQLTYDLNNFVDVDNIVYGGHGEQWNMVLENIQESERFYSILTIGEAAISSSVVLFNNYLDQNTSDEASHNIKDAQYEAYLNYENGVLCYSIKLKTNINIQLFGNVNPQIDMWYNIEKNEKIVRIQLSENNALKYVVSENLYVFAIEYGIETVSRKAYFQIQRMEDESVQGHIYEYVQFKDKDLVPACASFFINKDYTSVVGNKASGMAGFSGYINELYATEEGKLLVYEVRETLTIMGVSGTYNTLWFNLNDISGIENVKAIANENLGVYGDNNHDIYLNNSSKIFEPTKNSKLGISTSRKYDVELRKQYFYGYENDQLVKYECSIPMMFIQADNDKDTNFSDFPSDIKSKNKIEATVTLEEKHLTKVQLDYSVLIDMFIVIKDEVNSKTIEEYIGNPLEIN